MKQISFKNLNVGIVDDPSIEIGGGFEFASGIDIFSEPGVCKACQAMKAVSFGAGATPADVPRYMVDTADASNTRAYIAAGAKLLESTDGQTWNLFLTNSQGNILGLGIFNGYVFYPSSTKLGRCLVGNNASPSDSYQTLDQDDEFHPVLTQGGTLKVGAGRYVASLDETGTFTQQAMKLPNGYRIRTFAEFVNRLFMGTRFGAFSGGVTTAASSVFDWDGIVLSSGVALPTTPYPQRLRGMNALLSGINGFFAFPDILGDIHEFDGSQFQPSRKVMPISLVGTQMVNPGAVCEHIGTVLFAGDTSAYPGVYQMRRTAAGIAICQAFVPSAFTPGNVVSVNIGFVRSAFNGLVTIGYYNPGSGLYKVEVTDSSNKQNNAVIRTLWHSMNVGRTKLGAFKKRWGGVKLHLKPLETGCSVAVAYRTSRDASFTDSGQTITSANQDSPLLFTSQPRSKEIQFRFTFTTHNNATPELLGYDVLFQQLLTSR